MTKDDWQNAAYHATRKLLRKQGGKRLMAEQLLAPVIEAVGEPTDRRSYGAVIRRLHADGHIRRAGIGNARTSHRSPKPLWMTVA